jgi:lipopolysaccharide transport protein LptA
MVASSPDLSNRRCPPRRARYLGLVLWLLGALPAAGQQQPITLDAASSDFDRRNERLMFKEVRIQQGELVISADQAESRDLEFASGSWSFSGNVRIVGPMGEIESETASVSFANHRLTRATAQGEPAHFSRTMPGPDGRQVTGTAQQIEYDLARGELALAGQAALRDGLREVSGGRLLYRVEEDRLIASSDEEREERVRIVITPPAESADDGAGEENGNGDGGSAEAGGKDPGM